MRTERGNSCKESVVGWLVSQPVIGSVKACVHWDPPANRFTFIPEKPINFSICGNFIKLYRGLCWDNRRGTVCIVPPTLSCAVTDFWGRVWFGWEWNEISLINICQTSLWKVFQSNTLWMSEKRLHFCFHQHTRNDDQQPAGWRHNVCFPRIDWRLLDLQSAIRRRTNDQQ